MSFMWLCYKKDEENHFALFIANTEEQVTEMIEYHWIRTYFDEEERTQSYPIEKFNIVKFKELRKEKFWLVFTIEEDRTPEDANTYHSNLLICNRKEDVLKLYRSVNDIDDSISNDKYDFIEMVPYERYWGIYYKSDYIYSDKDHQCIDVVTADTEKDALEKLKYDLYYIKNMSLVMDMMVMFHTAKIVLLGRGSR